MSQIQSVKLEILREGPAHNQLLSPLTPYLALCGAEGPVTVHMPFEHQQLLTRLDRLRYVVEGVNISASQREAEVHEIGEALGKVLGEVPGLVSELSRARSDGCDLVHLRLSMTAHELGLVPFELAIGSDGFPGSGSALFLQSIAPITLTREVRRGRPLPVNWDRPPRILFAFAAPGNLPPVPAQEHLEALRRAIDPWVKWKKRPEDRLSEVKGHLTVLANASIQKIHAACAENAYTHVHILAHGEQLSNGHYGIDLCADDDGAGKECVAGDALATALMARNALGTTTSCPTVVSLATCDSGNAGSVVTAGGSIAHALHDGGIPWVIASQFPLWMHSSSIATEVLYEGLLRGDDPRWVLCAVRKRLRTGSMATHDWASIVAYAVVPWDFEEQVKRFRNRQTRQRVEIKFDEAEQRSLARSSTNDQSPTDAVDASDLEPIYDEIRRLLSNWYKELPQNASPQERAERLGMTAAGEKRIGNLKHGDPKTADAATKAYKDACDFYKQAAEADPVNHWVMTQYLSMLAVLADPSKFGTLADDYRAWWSAARQIARWKLRNATGRDRAWALGTLAELELLGAVYDATGFDHADAQKNIVALCRQLCEAVSKDEFPVSSTRRQFLRYLKLWPNPRWQALAQAAVDALPEGASWAGRAYLGPDPT